MIFPQKNVHFIAINDGGDSVQGGNDFALLRNVKLTKLPIKKLQNYDKI